MQVAILIATQVGALLFLYAILPMFDISRREAALGALRSRFFVGGIIFGVLAFISIFIVDGCVAKQLPDPTRAVAVLIGPVCIGFALGLILHRNPME